MKFLLGSIAVAGVTLAHAANHVVDMRMLDDVLIEEWGTNLIFQDQVVENGDTVTLISNIVDHDVVVIGAKNCNLAAAGTPVGSSFNNGITQGFTFTVNAGTAPFPALGDFFVTCSKTGHCGQGQIIKFTVIPPQPTVSPTDAPSVSPTASPTTNAPTQNPTVSPTASPVETINTRVQWSLPQNLVRFKQKAIITAGETITFDVTGNHNLLEFPTKESFDTCNFTEARVISLGFTQETIDDFQVGQVRWFGCNNTQANGDVHCELGQKMAIQVVNRGDEVVIPWLEPKDDATKRFYAEPRPVLQNSVVRFEFNVDANQHDVVQVFSKAAFDACDLSQGIEINAQPGDSGFIVYHDLFFNDDEPKLWFVCSKADHCQQGQKIQVLLVDATDAPTAAPEAGGDDNVLVIAIAAVAAVAIVSLAAFFILRSRRNAGRVDMENKMAMTPNVPVNNRGPAPDVEVAKSPYAASASPRPNMASVQSTGSAGTSSLARSKAALSGLNF